MDIVLVVFLLGVSVALGALCFTRSQRLMSTGGLLAALAAQATFFGFTCAALDFASPSAFAAAGGTTGIRFWDWLVFVLDGAVYVLDVPDALNSYGLRIAAIGPVGWWAKLVVSAQMWFWALFLVASLKAFLSSRSRIISKVPWADVRMFIGRWGCYLFQGVSALLAALAVFYAVTDGPVSAGCAAMISACLASTLAALLFFYWSWDEVWFFGTYSGNFSIWVEELMEENLLAAYLLGGLFAVLAGAALIGLDVALAHDLLAGQASRPAVDVLAFAGDNVLRILDVGDTIRTFGWTMQPYSPQGWLGGSAVFAYRFFIGIWIGRAVLLSFGKIRFLRFATIESLLEMLADGSEDVHEAAKAEILRRRPDESLWQFVEKAAGDDTADLRDHEATATAINLLIEMAASPRTDVLLELLWSDKVLVSRAAGEYVRKANTTDLVPKISQELLGVETKMAVHCVQHALEVIQELSPSDLDSVLGPLFRSPLWDRRVAAVMFVSEKRLQGHVQNIISALDEEDDFIKAMAVSAVGSLGIRGECRRLLQMLADHQKQDSQVLTHLVSTVHELCGAVALPPLERFALSDDGPAGMNALEILAKAEHTDGLRNVLPIRLSSEDSLTQLQALFIVEKLMYPWLYDLVEPLCHAKEEPVRVKAKEVLKAMRAAYKSSANRE